MICGYHYFWKHPHDPTRFHKSMNEFAHELFIPWKKSLPKKTQVTNLTKKLLLLSPKNNFLQWHFEGKKHPAFSDFNQPELWSRHFCGRILGVQNLFTLVGKNGRIIFETTTTIECTKDIGINWKHHPLKAPSHLQVNWPNVRFDIYTNIFIYIYVYITLRYIYLHHIYNLHIPSNSCISTKPTLKTHHCKISFSTHIRLTLPTFVFSAPSHWRVCRWSPAPWHSVPIVPLQHQMLQWHHCLGWPRESPLGRGGPWLWNSYRNGVVLLAFFQTKRNNRYWRLVDVSKNHVSLLMENSFKRRICSVFFLAWCSKSELISGQKHQVLEPLGWRVMWGNENSSLFK